MHIMQAKKWCAAAFCAAAIVLSSGCSRLKARDELNKGVQSYRGQHYADAVKHFQQAVQLDPSNQNAELYLATSYMVQWIPGADSPDNKKNYDAASSTFQNVLSKDPKNELALASMASMAFNSAASGTNEQKHQMLEEARKWNQRRIEVKPDDSEAYYYIGVINWTEAYQPLRDARFQLKMRPEDPGPISDPKVRAEMKDKYGKLIDEGLDHLKKCLDIDKENEDAMSYLNLLLRRKADIEDTPEAAKADVAQAEDWSNKSLDMKRIKATRPKKKEEAT